MGEQEGLSKAEQQVKKTVVIADDHAIVRQSLVDVLSTPGRITPEGLDIVDQAEDGFAVLAAVKRHKPNLLVLDVSMPLASGAEIIKDIRRSTNGNYALGNNRFKEEISVMLKQRVSPGKAGRPSKEG